MEKVDAIWHHNEMDEKFPSDLADRFQVRMPSGLRERLKAEAEANKRSMNAEIVARLEDSLDDAVYRHAARAMNEEWMQTLNMVAEQIERRHREAISKYEERIEALNRRLQGQVTPADIADTESRIRDVAERLRAEAQARQVKAG